LKQIRYRDLSIDGAPQFGAALNHQKRMAAQIEEVVVNSYPVNPQHLLPDVGDASLDLIPWGNETRAVA
jgi:hypothetical protein